LYPDPEVPKKGPSAVKLLKLIFASSILLLGAACSDRPDAESNWEGLSEAEKPVSMIENESGEITLLLTASHVSMRLSDETLEDISDDLDEAREETSGSKFADTVKNTVLDKVENMLNKQVNYPTENIERITWEDGRMIFTMEDGGEAWDGIWVGDDSVLESFSEDDAIEFIQEFETVKAAGQ
jgi:hypothetical protein